LDSPTYSLTSGAAYFLPISRDRHKAELECIVLTLREELGQETYIRVGWIMLGGVTSKDHSRLLLLPEKNITLV
jgi:hypothetical protein